MNESVRNSQGKFEIREFSSLNFRKTRGKESRVFTGGMKYTCSYTGKRLQLGKNSWAVLRMVYAYEGVLKEVMVSEKVVDVFADVVTYGPNVLYNGPFWKLHTKVMRVGLVREEVRCRLCGYLATEHLLLKYDDLSLGGQWSRRASMRMCARCVISYLELIERAPEIKECAYEHMVPRREKTTSKGRW
jgi:hypothetical protein